MFNSVLVGSFDSHDPPGSAPVYVFVFVCVSSVVALYVPVHV